MNRTLLFTAVLILISFVSLSQENASLSKECRISSGTGFSSSTVKSKGIGSDFWIQLSYDVLSNFSIATEFENMRYKQLDLYSFLYTYPAEINKYNDNFSLLVKYNFPLKKKLKFALSTGWTYNITQSEHYNRDSTGTLSSFSSHSTYNDYRIPFLAELEYPVVRNLYVQARVKFTTNAEHENTIRGGIGLSLKL